MSIPGSASPLLLTSAAAAGASEVERSLRFNKDSSAYLNRTPSSDGNKKTWTYSTWLKLSDVVTATQNLINAGDNSTLGRAILRYSGQQFQFIASAVGGTTSATVYTTAKMRDPNAWYHLVWSVDTTQATDTDRMKAWINGVAQTFATYTAPAQDGVFSINDNSLHKISGAVYTSGQYFNGYMAETALIDGQALDHTSFGEFDGNGVWQPKDLSGLTFGTNGFWLKFDDNSTTSALGTDSSGNGHNWTTNNFSVTAGSDNDSLFDSPTKGSQTETGAGGELSSNYAILSPIWASPNAAISDGGLQLLSGGGSYEVAISTISLLEKTYWETVVPASLTYYLPGIIRIDSNPISSGSYRIGISASIYPNSASIWPDAQAVYYNGSSVYNTGAIWSPGDIIGHAFDPATGNYYGWRNGSALNSGSAVATLSTSYTYAVALMTASTTNKAVINFGQRAFSYQNPGTDRASTDYKTLCTSNLTSSTITTSGSYTGNGLTDGPFVFLNGVPTAMTVGGTSVTFGTDADKTASGFKIRTTSGTFNTNATSYSYSITSTGDAFLNARAQTN